MPRKIIAGNWKMNLTVSEAQMLAQEIIVFVKNKPEPLVILCPPFPFLSALYYEISNSNVGLGAQNLHAEAGGAFTGEVSAAMLVSVGCEYVIIGHSERRTHFKETDELINKKVIRALLSRLTPILCIGETLEEREAGKTLERIRQQIYDDLSGVEITSGTDIIIAYEPVWAIGTGRNAMPEQAEEVQSAVRQLLAERYDQSVADEISILYGGSVNADNARPILAQPNVDGALVGGASLKPAQFKAIIDASQ
jgi:triosephosphate isomerase